MKTWESAELSGTGTAGRALLLDLTVAHFDSPIVSTRFHESLAWMMARYIGCFDDQTWLVADQDKANFEPMNLEAVTAHDLDLEVHQRAARQMTPGKRYKLCDDESGEEIILDID
jgi:hypothetical protein